MSVLYRLRTRLLLLASLLGLVCGLAGSASFATTPVQVPATADPRAQIISKLPGTRVEDLRPSPIPGIYELTRGASIAYVTADGRYAISGDLIDIAADDNLTEIHRREVRVGLINAIPESDMIVFGPDNAPYTVTVFTDVDCAYCRELHRQIADYNRLGIRVRYLSFPRSGPNTESWFKAEKVWCAENRNEALTAAKRDMPLEGKTCPGNPVASEYALGHKLRLNGTPAIVTAGGELLGGYVPPAELAQRLRQPPR